MMFKKKKDNNHGYITLLIAIAIAGMILTLNFIVFDMRMGNNPKTIDYSDINVNETKAERAWWDIPGHITDMIGGAIGGFIRVITLDVPLTSWENTGFFGVIIRGIYGIMLIIGLIEIIWIG